MDAPPAIHAPAHAFDYERAIGVIIQLEQTPWDKPGGALCFRPESWAEDSSLPYRYASEPNMAKIVALRRLSRFAVIAESKGVVWTPIVAFAAWRFGIAYACLHARRHSKYSALSYPQRGENLYRATTFP